MRQNMRVDTSAGGFVAVFEACHDSLMRYAIRRVGRQDAPDLVADTFAVALRRWQTAPPPREPLPWLYAVAHNRLRNDQRRRHADAVLSDRLAGLAERLASAPNVDRVSIISAMRTLSLDDREILFLTAWEGLEARHVATVLRCSPASARVRLHRARRRLADALAGTPTPDTTGKVHR